MYGIFSSLKFGCCFVAPLLNKKNSDVGCGFSPKTRVSLVIIALHDTDTKLWIMTLDYGSR